MPHINDVQLFNVRISGTLDDRLIGSVNVESFSQENIIQGLVEAIKPVFDDDYSRLEEDGRKLDAQKMCLEFTLQQLEMQIDLKEKLEMCLKNNGNDAELRIKLSNAEADISLLESARSIAELDLDYNSRAFDAARELLSNLDNGMLTDYKVAVCEGKLFAIHRKHHALDSYSGQVIKESGQAEPLSPSEDMKNSFSQGLVGE
ncbi:hypothetical protein IWW36_002273 [Coemansia brasiliensis]|uniref:Uncharacterized protein n=1 Tax=Coemansia brasiliensis TaxID=2650707 RepID=A0A9W8I889_9FUNG|nr:hypothetical protein IWW36_002273 [Coemansia brasiliensis]